MGIYCIFVIIVDHNLMPNHIIGMGSSCVRVEFGCNLWNEVWHSVERRTFDHPYPSASSALLSLFVLGFSCHTSRYGIVLIFFDLLLLFPSALLLALLTMLLKLRLMLLLL